MAPLGKDAENKMANKTNSQFIFRASITINGVTYYAKNYGKRAFRIPVSKLK